MNRSHRNAVLLLRFDAMAGGIAGAIGLVLHRWLATLYGFSETLVLVFAAANLLYASYSGTLALRAQSRRFPPPLALDILVAANFLWAMFCASVLATTWDTASVFGKLHAALECLFLLVLSAIEWHCFRSLRTEARYP